MKLFKIFLGVFISIYSSVLLASVADVIDKCKDVKPEEDYDLHIFSVDKDDVQKLVGFCQLYYGIENKEPDYINKALNLIIERSNGLAFLKDIDFKIKTFESKTDENGFGFSYNYNKTNPLTAYSYNPDQHVTTGMAWNFSAKGNVAFDSAINPEDFLDTRFSIAGFRDYGGVSKVATDSTFQQLNDLDDQAVDLEGAALEANRKKTKDIISHFFSTQTYIHYDLNAGLESNQRFTERQWTYGFNVALDAKSYNKKSALANWNIVDYPFALVRMLTGYGNNTDFKPLGSTFPTFVIGLDQVDPITNSVRESLGEKDKFDRAKAEIYFRTPIGFIKQQEIFANIDYRYWKELSPSAAIKSAGIDTLSYATLSISSANGIFVSYSHGKLPFDLESTRVYELGWKFNFD
ncbi:MAG: hypothetical protein EOO53_13925 [Gammaproteobacteria bacterium]|nr:MAG: hypothetical protein EOO53_13925 [Gammaproteobacteria bacterium]